MRSFRDSKNRTWTFSINVGSIKRVKSLTGVDLLDPEKAMSIDVIQLVDVVYALCKPEADQLGISDEQFGEGFSGDVLSEVSDLYRDEYVDFFPQARTRAILKRTLDKVRTAETTQLNRIESTLDQKIDQALQKYFEPHTDSQV